MYITKYKNAWPWTRKINDIYYNRRHDIANLTDEELKGLHPRLTSYRNSFSNYYNLIAIGETVYAHVDSHVSSTEDMIEWD
tara:strand:- start:2327 stop:2569 length:243 start_codon:yes stop_codon:yes gene_type:complete